MIESKLQESKLLSLKKLGDSDGEDDTSKWVERQKKLQKEKELASKRVKAQNSLPE